MMPERLYTLEVPNQRIALQEASKMARADGIDPLHAKVLSWEPLFAWGEPKIRCIVVVKGPNEDEWTEAEKRMAWGDR